MTTKLIQSFLIAGSVILVLSCTTLAERGSSDWEAETITGRIRQRKEEKSTTETERIKPIETEQTSTVSREVSDIQNDLIRSAESFIGKDELIVRGKQFPMDCTGVVLAIYYSAGIDLAKDFSLYTGNGVHRLYSYLEENGLLYDTMIPKPGDIIFWDNTYDRNEDGAWNDPFTHTGMVVSASEWGTIEYIHHNYRKGIVKERMNLKEPDIHQKEIEGDIVIINAPMRMRGSPKGPGWLASHLYRDFGKGYSLPRE